MTNTPKTLDDAELDAVQGGAASRHREGIVTHRRGGHHSDEQTGQEAVVNYTKFITLRYKGFAVTTGWNFKRSGEKPHSQYCYASQQNRASNASDRLDLARKLEQGPVVYSALKAPEVRPFKIPAGEMMALAKSHCRFTDGISERQDPIPRRQRQGDRDA